MLQLPLLAAAAFIYVTNKLFLTSLLHDTWASTFMTGYLNDLVAPIAFFSLVNISFAMSKRCLISIVPLLILCSIASLAWELDPFAIRPGSTADWLDVVCYFIGTFCYWLIVRRIYNNKRSSTQRSEENPCR